jgi:hypothetical protein
MHISLKRCDLLSIVRIRLDKEQYHSSRILKQERPYQINRPYGAHNPCPVMRRSFFSGNLCFVLTQGC